MTQLGFLPKADPATRAYMHIISLGRWTRDWEDVRPRRRRTTQQMWSRVPTVGLWAQCCWGMGGGEVISHQVLSPLSGATQGVSTTLVSRCMVAPMWPREWAPTDTQRYSSREVLGQRAGCTGPQGEGLSAPPMCSCLHRKAGRRMAERT